jgi:intracellular sulfur oxidation DsrE/DsrF family protein
MTGATPNETARRRSDKPTTTRKTYPEHKQEQNMKFLSAFIIGLVAIMSAAGVATAKDAVHKVAIHVDQNDPKVMNLALNNAQNLIKYYAKKKQKADVVIVTYGPGLHMLRKDTSPVQNRIAAMSLANPNLTFNACGNTHRKMSKQAGKKVALISEAKMVTSGVVRLVELQQAGYAYVKP